jgi:hypothetical protein
MWDALKEPDHTKNNNVSEAVRAHEFAKMFRSMFAHAVQSAPAEPLGLNPRGKPAARRKERGSAWESRAISAARKAYATILSVR